MESQPQKPEFRNNPENFHPWIHAIRYMYDSNHLIIFIFRRSICSTRKSFHKENDHVAWF